MLNGTELNREIEKRLLDNQKELQKADKFFIDYMAGTAIIDNPVDVQEIKNVITRHLQRKLNKIKDSTL